MVYRTCYTVTRNAHDAEDAAQAAFISLAQQIREGTEIRHVGSWLQQVANRCALDLCRGRQRRRRREDVVRQNRPDNVLPACRVDAAELAEIVRAELQHLPPDYRTPLILHYYGGLSSAQIARQLNCGVKALGMRLLRGRRMLATRLSERGVMVGSMALTAAMVEVLRRNVAMQVAAAHSVGAAHGLGASIGFAGGVPGELAIRLLRMIAARPKQAFFTAALLAGTAIGGGSQVVRDAASRVLDLGTLRGLLKFDLNLRRLLPAPRVIAAVPTPQPREHSPTPISAPPSPSAHWVELRTPSGVGLSGRREAAPQVAFRTIETPSPVSAIAGAARSFNLAPTASASAAQLRLFEPGSATYATTIGRRRGEANSTPAAEPTATETTVPNEPVASVEVPSDDLGGSLGEIDASTIIGGLDAAAVAHLSGQYSTDSVRSGAGGLVFANGSAAHAVGMSADSTFRYTTGPAGLPEPTVAPLLIFAATWLGRRRRA